MGCGEHRAGSQGAGSGAQPPKSPNPPSPRACVGAGRGQKPPQQPPAPHRQQLAPEIWDFTPSLCRSAGVVWLSTPPAHPGTTAPPAHRRRLGTRRYPGERRGRVRAGRSLPRAGFLLRSQKARFPQPQCAGIELAQPQNPPGIPGGTAAGTAPCTGEPQGVPGAVVLSRGWWGSEDALSPVPSPGGAVPVPTAHKGKVESPSSAPGAGRELGELGRKRRAQAAGGFPSTSPSISPSSNYTSLRLNPENKTSSLGYSDGTPAQRKK